MAAVERWVLGLVALASGCDRVFAIDELAAVDVPDAMVTDAGRDAPTYDRCAPIPDDPLRYTEIANPTSDALGVPLPWSWAEARVECLRRGMDLAVMNDDHEVTTAQIERRPYWVGVASDGTAWATVDGCPTASPPAPVAGSQCGYIMTGATLGATDCSGQLAAPQPDDPTAILGALCETPRPAEDCGPQGAATSTYVLSDAALSYAAARVYCEGMGAHLAVVNSHAELRQLASLAVERAYPSVWIGATFDAQTWQSDTSCPGLYAWADGAPVFGVATTCLATTMRADSSEESTGAMTLAGMTPTPCDDTATRALCELE